MEKIFERKIFFLFLIGAITGIMFAGSVSAAVTFPITVKGQTVIRWNVPVVPGDIVAVTYMTARSDGTSRITVNGITTMDPGVANTFVTRQITITSPNQTVDLSGVGTGVDFTFSAVTINGENINLVENPIPAPDGLRATAGDGKVTLSWNLVSNINGYNVYVNGTKVNTSSLVPTTNYTVTGLNNGTEYTFWVTAVRNSDESKPSASVKAKPEAPPPDTIPPSTPTNIKLVAGNAQVTVSWSPSVDNIKVVGYNIYRNGQLIVSGWPNTSYLDTGLINGTNYTYEISAIDAAGNESPKSSPTTVRPTDIMTVTFVPNKDSIIVQIANGTPPFEIDWGSGSATASSSAYTITGLQEATDYTITVIDAGGQMITQTVNTGSIKSFVPPLFPAPDNIFQSMLDNFGEAGTIAVTVILGAVALGIICILGLYGWRMAKRWLNAAR